MRHRRIVIAVASCVAAVLVGCASPPPRVVVSDAPITTPTPTAVSDPATEPAALVIGAHALVLVDESGSTIGELSFYEPGSVAVAFLTDAFGAPPVFSRRESDHHCVGAANLATWGEYFVLDYDTDGWTPAGQASSVMATARTGANGLALDTGTGFGVGDPVDGLLASHPGAGSDSTDWEGRHYQWVHYEVGAGVFVDPNSVDYGKEPYWGASAAAIDGIITTLQAPLTYVDQC